MQKALLSYLWLPMHRSDMKHTGFLFTAFALFATVDATAQNPAFTHDDTLRGSITPQRA